MQKIIVLSFFTFVIICCSANNEKVEYDKKVQFELRSGIRNDTIFLGYFFGMTENHFNWETKELYNEGVLYLNDDQCYAYEMNLDEGMFGKAEATFSPSFYNNTLYKLTVDVVTKFEISVPSIARLLQAFLRNLLSQKYSYDYLIQEGIVDNSKNYIWIQGNREIKLIEAIGKARIFYIDLSVEERNDNYERELAKEAVKDTKSKL